MGATSPVNLRELFADSINNTREGIATRRGVNSTEVPNGTVYSEWRYNFERREAMALSQESSWKPSPMTDEELDRALVEDLKDDWPTMDRQKREHYAQVNPGRMGRANLSISDPYREKDPDEE